MKTFLNGKVTLYGGDSREVLKTLPDNSIDSVVCDPPYALVSIVKRFGGENAAPAKGDVYARASAGFMGKQWDTGETAFAAEFWAEVLRVLKPGGHVVAFSGTRTYHRMACAIEDAGFEIRDCIMWVYGQGFPKSLNVAIAIDKATGAQGARGEGFNAAGGILRTNGSDSLRSDHPDFKPYAPKTDAARQWQGWGTALKPSLEPICLARKPLIGTVAENVQTFGTGALNIDGCRIESGADYHDLDVTQGGKSTQGFNVGGTGSGKRNGVFQPATGRWPANLCLGIPADEYELRDGVKPEQKRELYRWLSENT